MKVELNRNIATPYLNLMRSIAMTQIPCIRPIAFSVGNSNLVTAGNTVMEDMIEFNNNLSSLKYRGNFSKDLEVVSLVCNGVLKSSDLEKKGLKVCSDSDSELLHVLNNEIQVTVYFYCGTNTMNTQESKHTLEANGVAANNNIIPMNANFSCIKKFAYSLVSTKAGKEEYEVTIETDNGMSEEEVWSFCKNFVTEC